MKPHITTDADGAIVVRIPAATVAAPDKLVAFPFAELGLTERNAARVLAARVRTVRLGRKTYAKRSDLLAAIDALAREQAAARAVPKPKTDDAQTGYLALVGGKR